MARELIVAKKGLLDQHDEAIGKLKEEHVQTLQEKLAAQAEEHAKLLEEQSEKHAKELEEALSQVGNKLDQAQVRARHTQRAGFSTA